MSSKPYANEVFSVSTHPLLDIPFVQSGKPSSRELPENGRRSILQSESGSDQFSLTEQPSRSIKVERPGFQFTRRLGRYLLITNTVALAVVIGSLSALSFLWFGNDRNSHWRYVMINGWMGQAITLAALTIRLAVGIQASTAVAMLASISLEASDGVLLGESPALSISRYVNTGPFSALPTFWRNAASTKSNYTFVAMVVLATCTLLSQFSSTLLLWDVRSDTVRGFTQPQNRPVGMGMQSFVERFEYTISRGNNIWVSSPQSFQAFAEWTKPPEAELDAVADTGPTVRAFLPVGSELERSKINKYEGTASLFDARVACIRPAITNWTFLPGNVLDDSSTRGYFKGFARPAELPYELKQILRYNESGPGIFFQCLIDDLDVLSDPMVKACFLRHTDGGLINSLDQTSNSSMTQYLQDDVYPFTSEARTGWVGPDRNSIEQWPIEMGHTFLMLRSQGETDNMQNRGWQLLVNNFTQEKNGVWLNFRPNVAQDLPYAKSEFGVSLCYDSWYNNGARTNRLKHLQDFPISARGPSNYSEPSIGWKSKKNAFDTKTIRLQLGDGLITSGKRGVFELDIDGLHRFLRTAAQEWSPTYNVSFKDVHSGQTQWFLNTSGNGPDIETLAASPKASSLFENGYITNETYDFLNSVIWWPFSSIQDDVDHYEIYAPCEDCTSSSTTTSSTGYRDGVAMQVLSPILNAIFRDVLLETNNPALAWQALMTTVLRMAYYGWLPTFDSISEVKMVPNVACMRPMYFMGFLIVVGNFFLHSCLILITTIYFGKATQFSLLNSAWQVVAQLKGPETERLLDSATETEDSEVKQWIAKGGERRRRFWIKRSEQHGGARLC